MLAQALAYDTSPAKNGTESVTPLSHLNMTPSPLSLDQRQASRLMLVHNRPPAFYAVSDRAIHLEIAGEPEDPMA
jgi:hypothetical protein